MLTGNAIEQLQPQSHLFLFGIHRLRHLALDRAGHFLGNFVGLGQNRGTIVPGAGVGVPAFARKGRDVFKGFSVTKIQTHAVGLDRHSQFVLGHKTLEMTLDFFGDGPGLGSNIFKLVPANDVGQCIFQKQFQQTLGFVITKHIAIGVGDVVGHSGLEVNGLVILGEQITFLGIGGNDQPLLVGVLMRIGGVQGPILRPAKLRADGALAFQSLNGFQRVRQGKTHAGLPHLAGRRAAFAQAQHDGALLLIFHGESIGK